MTLRFTHLSTQLRSSGAVPCLVTQLCPTLCDPTDCSPPGSSVHGDSPGKDTGVGCRALLQGIFPTQGSDPGLPHCGEILYCLSHQGSPRIPEWVAYPFSSGIFLTQESNRGLLHYRWVLYQLRYQCSSKVYLFDRGWVGFPPCGEAEFSTPWPDTRGPWKVSSVADTAGHILLGPTRVCLSLGRSPGLWGCLPWALASGFHSALPFCALSSHPGWPPPRPAELCPDSHGTHGISPLLPHLRCPAHTGLSPGWDPWGLLFLP